jgi:hypothetical protein
MDRQNSHVEMRVWDFNIMVQLLISVNSLVVKEIVAVQEVYR